MHPLIFPVLFLGIYSTIAYFRGRKKNRWIAGWISSETEEVLQPRDKEYINIGGTIGYNITYKMDPPYKEAEGLFTLLPRHSALYLPISMLFVRYDRYFLHLFCTKKLLGEGHIVSGDYYPKMRTNIEGEWRMKKETTTKHNQVFHLFWEANPMEERLKKLLEQLGPEEAANLKHFCCYKDNKNFFIFMRPRREMVKKILGAIYPRLESFMVKGGE